MTIDEFGEIKTPFLRTAFNYDRDAESYSTAFFCEDETRTQQQFKEECDINTIVKNFGLTGELPAISAVPLVGEFEEIFDYQSALNKLREADAAFMAYPAELRAKFQNDPGRFVEFVSDPANKDEIKKMGLGAPESPRQAPIEVRVIPDPSPDAKTP